MEDNKYDEILEKLKSFESILNDIKENISNEQNNKQNNTLCEKRNFYIINLILSFTFIFLLEIYGLFYNKIRWVICSIVLFIIYVLVINYEKIVVLMKDFIKEK